jgi:hypothetical protein
MNEHLNGLWVTPKRFAELFGLGVQSLANQRSRERRLGRRDPNAPIWRRFGRSIRYFIPHELLDPRWKSPSPPALEKDLPPA